MFGFEAGPRTRALIEQAKEVLERINLTLGRFATSPGAAASLESIARSLAEVSEELRRKDQHLTILGGKIMFSIPNNQPDIPFSVSPVTATDEEGESIALTEELVSDNEGVISFLFDEGSSASNPRSGKAHVGTSGLANVNYTAKDPQGNIVTSEGAQFTVSTGPVSNVSGGDLAFEGVTES
jgi:hypothetical protein